jgi:hypothetical protein
VEIAQLYRPGSFSRHDAAADGIERISRVALREDRKTAVSAIVRAVAFGVEAPAPLRRKLLERETPFLLILMRNIRAGDDQRGDDNKNENREFAGHG